MSTNKTSTTQIATDRQHDQAKTVLPAEYACGIYIRHPPNAEALKVMYFLIGTAGGRMADDVDHNFKLSEMSGTKGIRNHSMKTLQTIFEELSSCVLTIVDAEKGITTIGGLLHETRIFHSEEYDGDLRVTWNFSKTFRRMAAESSHWSIIDRQTLYALTRKYSILLFQRFTTLQNLKHVTTKTFTVVELRSALGISDGKLTRFANFNAWALKPAIEEINQLARFTLTATPKKRGRTVVAVEISWEPKPDIIEDKEALLSPLKSVKHSGDITPPIPAKAFPASGSIEFSKPWNEIAKLNGNGKDKDLIAQDFRNWCLARNIPLDGPNIEKAFKGFCKKAKP